MKPEDINPIRPILCVMSKFLENQLRNDFTENEINEIIHKTNIYFENDIPLIPDVGADNPWLKSIAGVVFLTGLWIELQKYGWSIDKCSIMTQTALEEFTKANIPQENLIQIRDMQCSKAFVDSIALRSQKRIYKDDWFVETVLPDKEENFKIGYNVYQCPIIQYLKFKNLTSFAPYFCKNDYPMFKAMGISLERSQTLADGAKYCDFRLIEKPLV